jgi:hypothetical protein
MLLFSIFPSFRRDAWATARASAVHAVSPPLKLRVLFGDADVRGLKALLKVGDVKQDGLKPLPPQRPH